MFCVPGFVKAVFTATAQPGLVNVARAAVAGMATVTLTSTSSQQHAADVALGVDEAEGVPDTELDEIRTLYTELAGNPAKGGTRRAGVTVARVHATLCFLLAG